LLALELAEQNKRVVIADPRTAPPEHSMAIGITPPSLHILRKHGLDKTFIKEGVMIRSASLWEKRAYLGNVDLTSIPQPYPFILSLPQSRTVALLEEKVKSHPAITLRLGWEGQLLSHDHDAVHVRVTELATGQTQEIRAAYLSACDGHRSQVREQARMAVTTKAYRPQFMMGDFCGDVGLGDEAHLFFGAGGSVESFPLPRGKRRWIIQTDNYSQLSAEVLVSAVNKRCGYELFAEDCEWVSGFRPFYQLVDSYFSGRISFCGDAAHVMSPIGGQGMNTGFADAAQLALALSTALDEPGQAVTALSDYDRVRRRAFKIAARRAAIAMSFGAARGASLSRLRHLLVTLVLLRPRARAWLADIFSMLTIPSSIPAVERVGRGRVISS
jgi:2-polyprenyl-6-methoxyphenol hydroxylase-like FAD-dependent oxidoreductase